MDDLIGLVESIDPILKNDFRQSKQRNDYTRSQFFCLSRKNACTKPAKELKLYDHRAFSYYTTDMVNTKWQPAQRAKLLEFVSTQLSNIQDADDPIGKIDWIEISAHMGSTYKPMDCYIEYRNNLDTTINKSKWTKEEDSKLSLLASEHREHNWALISALLSTNRTPMQCLKRYQLYLNKVFVPCTTITLQLIKTF